MQDSIRELVNLFATCLPVQAPVYEFGAYQVQPADFSDMRQFFHGLPYVGCDMRPGPGVDHELDLYDMDLESCVAKTALCLETLEHCQYPDRVVSELHRVLDTGGLLLLTTVFDFPIHGHPSDFWRFTPQALILLLSAKFEHFIVGHTGPRETPVSVFAVAQREPEEGLERVDFTRLKTSVPDWKFHWWEMDS